MTSSHTPRLPIQAPEGIKSPVATATIDEIDLEGLQIINGYQLNVNDRVLVKDQTNLANNGIYSAQKGAWVRAKDWKVSQQVANGVLVLDNNTSVLWRANFAGVLNIGITDVTFSNVTSKGGLQTFVQEEKPVGPIIEGARWYIPSEATTYVFYYDESGDGVWVEEPVAYAEAPLEYEVRITTLELINSEDDVDAGTVVETTGFYFSGDGCGADFVATSTTGLTPSRTFTQTGGLYIVDGSGRRWNLVRQGNQIALWKLGCKSGSNLKTFFDVARSQILSDGHGTIIVPYAPEDNPLLLSGSLSMVSGMELAGLGMDKTWIKMTDGSNTNTALYNSDSGVIFRDFSIDGNAANQTAGNGFAGTAGADIEFRNIRFKNIYNDCIIGSGYNNVRVYNIVINGGGKVGAGSKAVSFGTTTDLIIDGVVCLDYIGAAVNLSVCEDFTVSNIVGKRDPVADGWTFGKGCIRFTNSCLNGVVNNVVSYGFSRGIFILTGSKYISVSNFNIQNCESSGVWISGDPNDPSLGQECSKIMLTNGTIKDVGQGAAPTDFDSVFLTDTFDNTISNIWCNADIVEKNLYTTDANKNIITGNRVLGSITTVGANTVTANNITGA